MHGSTPVTARLRLLFLASAGFTLSGAVMFGVPGVLRPDLTGVPSDAIASRTLFAVSGDIVFAALMLAATSRHRAPSHAGECA